MKFILMSLPIILGFIYILLRIDGKNKTKFFYIELGICCLLLGFQDNFGVDYQSYVNLFYHPNLFSVKKGILYKKILEFLLITTNNSRSMFILMAVLNFIIIYKIIKFLKDKLLIQNEIIFFMFLLLMTYVNMFNAVRNSFAELCLTYAILLYYFENKKIKTISYFIFGMLIHPSIVIWSPLFFLKKFFVKKKNITFIICGLFICFIINDLNLIPRFAEWLYYNFPWDFRYKKFLISKHMQTYQTSLQRFGIAKYIRLLVTLISIHCYSREINKEKIVIYNITYLAMICYFLVVAHPIIERVANELIYFRVMIFYFMFYFFGRKNYLYLSFTIVIVYYLLYLRQIHSMILMVATRGN